MLIGYARVSTSEQDTALQLDALRSAGVTEIYSESGSSVGPRPQLHRAIAAVAHGDVLVVWKIDRMARSLSDLLQLLQRLRERGVGLKSLTEPIDTTTPMGEFVLQILGAVAQLERSMIRQRSIAGQVAAIKRGVVIGGRPKKLTTGQMKQAAAMRSMGSTWYAIGERLGVSHTTARRAVLGDNRDRMRVLKDYL